MAIALRVIWAVIVSPVVQVTVLSIFSIIRDWQLQGTLFACFNLEGAYAPCHASEFLGEQIILVVVGNILLLGLPTLVTAFVLYYLLPFGSQKATKLLKKLTDGSLHAGVEAIG